MLHYRFPGNRNHWFRAANGQWSQPRSFPACHNNRFHEALLCRRIAQLLRQKIGRRRSECHAVPIVLHSKRALQVSLSDLENPETELPIAQATVIDQPAHKAMVVGLLGCLPFLVLLTQPDKLASLIHRKALVQEGIDEQIHVLLHVLFLLWKPSSNDTLHTCSHSAYDRIRASGCFRRS